MRAIMMASRQLDFAWNHYGAKKKGPRFARALEGSNSLAMLRVVFLAIDIARHMILLTCNFGFFCRGQGTAVGGLHASGFAVDVGLAMLKARRFLRGQLAGLDALGDALLLVDLALADGRRRGSWSRGRSLRGCRQHQGYRRHAQKNGLQIDPHNSPLPR